jgi:hypothetical protein
MQVLILIVKLTLNVRKKLKAASLKLKANTNTAARYIRQVADTRYTLHANTVRSVSHCPML